MNSVAAENKATLNGNVLKIEDSRITLNTPYSIVIYNEGKIIFRNNYSGMDGNILIDDKTLNYPTIKYIINQNNIEILNGTISNEQTLKIDKKKEEAPLAEVTKTSLDPTTSSQASETPAPPDSKTPSTFWGIDQIYFIIFGVFLIVLVAAWYLYRTARDSADQPDSYSNELPQLQSNGHKLKIELMDDTLNKISDKIINITNKKNGSQSSYRPNINGEYNLPDLIKGTYIIKVEGGEKYEDASKEINICEDNNIQIPLTRRQPLQIELVDESGTPLRGMEIRVLELPSNVDLLRQSPKETDNDGVAKFYLSKNKQYVTSIQSIKGDFIKQEKIPINNSETTKRIQLIKRTGTLEVTVAEQPTGKTFASIPVTVTKKGTNSTDDYLTDEAGKINKKIPVGEYIIRLKPSSFSLYESGDKTASVTENRMSKITLDFRFNYQAKPQDKQLIDTIQEKLEISYKEVSAYDACIPLFFKRVGEKPTQLVKNITERPVEFLGAKTSPDEMISYILRTAEFMTGEISRIMREKSNVDFYYSIHNLEPVTDLNVSDYSQDKFRELVRDIENYHKNHKTEVGNKLHEIDAELTKWSGDLTIQPVADLWRVAQKLQESSLNESDIKKRGVMLFLNDKLLDHVREMYSKDEVIARLKFSMI
jgi:hypothetical protein